MIKMITLYRYFIFFVIFSAFLSGNAISGEKVWVTSRSVELKSDASASSSTVQSLDIGTELIVQSKQRRWYKVSTPEGRTGYVYQGNVSSTPPSGSRSGLFGSMDKSGIQVSRADTSRSIRGLSPEAKEYAKSTGTPAEIQRALENVLVMRTTDQEIDRFLQSGRIGEYAQ